MGRLNKISAARLLAGFALVSAASPAPAQALEPFLTLGMSETEFHAALTGVERVRRPQKLSSGAIGSWRLPRVQHGRFFFEETFFLGSQALQQVEFVLLPRSPEEQTQSAFAGLVEALRSQWGQELASHTLMPGMVMETASWVREGLDVIAVRSGNPANPGIRVIYKLRLLKDASQL